MIKHRKRLRAEEKARTDSKKFRNAEICRLRTEFKMPYKQISHLLGCTHGVVTCVLKSERAAGRCLRRSEGANPFSFILDRSKTNGMTAGKISTICEILGLEATQWIWKTRPEGMTFAEAIGVICKDAYLEHLDENENTR
jgi:hypothetical protein